MSISESVEVSTFANLRVSDFERFAGVLRALCACVSAMFPGHHTMARPFGRAIADVAARIEVYWPPEGAGDTLGMNVPGSRPRSEGMSSTG